MAVVALIALNAWIVGRLFYTPYTVQMGSIEAAYISLAHYIAGHFPQSTFFTPTWFPLWYGGIPYPDSYPPLSHFVNAFVTHFAGISPGLAYHIVAGCVYALTPAALYWTARRLGAGIAGAFTGALLYSLVSPSCFLFHDLRIDAHGWFGPRRFVNLAIYGEGPIQFSLLFLVLSIALLHLALERRRPVYYFAASAAMACVALSNWIGAFGLALMAGAYLLTKMGGSVIYRWVAAAAMAIAAYALAVPWLTPSVVVTIQRGAQVLVGFQLSSAARWAIVAIAAELLLLAWWIAKLRIRPQLSFAIFAVLAIAPIPIASGYLNIEMIPQPMRYHAVLDLAVCLAIAIAMPAHLRKTPAIVLAVCLFLFTIPVAIHQRSIGRGWIKPIDIHRTVQYEVSTWLQKNMPGQRVFAPGSIGFWMDAFSDTPMLTGAFDNGITNPLIPGVKYQIYAGDNRDLAVAWMKAYGVDAVIASEQRSREVFDNYRFPNKFRGLAELWRDGGDVIYAVPRGTTSLAHAMRESDMVKITPVAYEQTIIAPYLQALEDPSLPPADFRWKSPHEAIITANLSPEHLVSVQVTFDEGWRARVNGQKRRTWADKLGQIAIAPDCNGSCTIDLTYDGTPIDHIADVVSPLAAATGLIWVIVDVLRRRK